VSAGVLTVGDVTFSGSTVNFDVPPVIGGGAVNVLTYTGVATGTVGTDLVVANASSYRNATLVDTAGVITLDIQNANLTWDGTSGGQWNVLTSARWNTGETDQFAWGDAVTFDDNGVTTAVNITGELRPSSMTVTGTKNYTIAGGSGNFISGTVGISKSGSSTLLLNAPNTFSGANTITQGIVQVGDGTNNTAAIGTGNVAISSGASLVFFRNSTPTIANPISGPGTLAFQGTGASGISSYTITGTNTAFSGTLEARNGARVQLDSTNDVGTSSIVVNSGGQIYLTNGTTYSAGAYFGTNGVFWTRDGTNYWILFQ
jgi:autotransporter-associated beta strand protein